MSGTAVTLNQQPKQILCAVIINEYWCSCAMELYNSVFDINTVGRL